MKDELIGLKELDSEVLECGDCGAKLIDVVLTETNENRDSRGLKPLKSKYKVSKCFKCGGSSFDSKTFEGSTAFGAIFDDVVVDTEYTDILGDGTVYTVLHTWRCAK